MCYYVSIFFIGIYCVSASDRWVWYSWFLEDESKKYHDSTKHEAMVSQIGFLVALEAFLGDCTFLCRKYLAQRSSPGIPDTTNY